MLRQGVTDSSPCQLLACGPCTSGFVRQRSRREASLPKPMKVPGLSRRTPLAVAGPLIVRARLADVRRHEATLARDGEPDEDAVHDMRVAARRLRAALEALGDDALTPP